MSLETLLQRADIWRGRGNITLRPGHVPTGHPALDASLPGGGWPLGALSEILSDRDGIGELRLLIPALVRLGREDRWQVWIGTPHLPYAPALAGAGVNLARLLLVQPQSEADRLWALEQSLRSGGCSAVLGWLPDRVDERRLRRLQLAAEAGRCLAFLFRPSTAAHRPSPAALRLRLETNQQGLMIQILKCRGGRAGGPVLLAVSC